VPSRSSFCTCSFIVAGAHRSAVPQFTNTLHIENTSIEQLVGEPDRRTSIQIVRSE
jgi:hypothetical protein